MGVEPDREFGRVVDPAVEPARDIAKAEIGLQRLLGIDQEKTLPEVGDGRASLQPVIGSKDRSTGHTGEKIKPIEQRHRASARRHSRLIETFQHTVGKSGSAHAAAGKR